MNDLSAVQSDYEQPPSHRTAAERDILASVLHVADKFCPMPAGQRDAGDRLLDAADDATDSARPPPPALKDIRTRSDCDALMMMAMAGRSAKRPPTADACAEGDAIIRELIDDVLLAIWRPTVVDDEVEDDRDDDEADDDADDAADTTIIDGRFVTAIVHDASLSIVSIPRSVGVHDLHLDSSRALLDGSTGERGDGGIGSGGSSNAESDAKASQTEPQQLEPLMTAAAAAPAKTRITESITDIVDYEQLPIGGGSGGKDNVDDEEAAAETLPALPEPRLLELSGRVESVGSAQSIGMAALMARKSAMAGGAGGKGTWSRIKKVFSSMGGRSQLNIPN